MQESVPLIEPNERILEINVIDPNIDVSNLKEIQENDLSHCIDDKVIYSYEVEDDDTSEASELISITTVDRQTAYQHEVEEVTRNSFFTSIVRCALECVS